MLDLVQGHDLQDWMYCPSKDNKTERVIISDNKYVVIIYNCVGDARLSPRSSPSRLEIPPIKGKAERVISN